jgi:hypothetical protein
MAERGKQFAHILAGTVRATDLLISHDEQLKILIAFIAVIFKKRHSISPCLNVHFIMQKISISKGLLKPLRSAYPKSKIP